MLPEENQQVIGDFLEAHQEYFLVPAGDAARKAGLAIQAGDYLELSPHKNACDGFFAAVLEKKPAPAKTSVRAVSDAQPD